MVATRRSGANAVSTSSIPPKPTKRRKIAASAKAEKTAESAIVQPYLSRKPSMSTNSTMKSKTSSELSDLTLTSPSIGRTPGRSLANKPSLLLHEQAMSSTEQVKVALKRLVTSGSSHDPIVLNEESPPAKIEASTRQHDKVEPHMFQDRHSKLYTYRPLRPALAPKPANGSTFTGQQSHDMYRMRTAKLVEPTWHPSDTQHVRQGFSFETQYPMSAQYLASQHGVAHHPTRPASRYYAPPPLPVPWYIVPPPLNEGHLRMKALQYVREYSRSSLRTRKAPEDPDETSGSGSEEIDIGTTLRPRNPRTPQVLSSSTKSKKSSITILPDPHIQLTPLIEHASLLTSLLRTYPQSKDQNGLRGDIAMLASVQNQHLADWLNFEVGQSRKLASPHKPCVSRSTTASPTEPIASVFTEQQRAEAEKKKEQDDKIRGLLSANGELWQDGSGLGVADVYAETRASTPATSQGDGDEPQEEGTIIAVLSPVRCAGKTATPSPNAPAKTYSWASTIDMEMVSKPPSKVVMPATSSAARAKTQRLVTQSPRVARTVSSPAVRTSGRKRMASARVRTE